MNRSLLGTVLIISLAMSIVGACNRQGQVASNSDAATADQRCTVISENIGSKIEFLRKAQHTVLPSDNGDMRLGCGWHRPSDQMALSVYITRPENLHDDIAETRKEYSGQSEPVVESSVSGATVMRIPGIPRTIAFTETCRIDVFAPADLRDLDISQAAVDTVQTVGCEPLNNRQTDETSRNFDQIPGQYPTPATLTGNGASEAAVGSCATLKGRLVDATLLTVDCGSREAVYRVIQRVNVPAECVQDADRKFYRNTKSGGQWTACLDLKWDESLCVNIDDSDVSKVECGDPNSSNKFKPTKIILNTTNIDGCSDGGYQHPIRRFTICTETQK
jgi:hypothetical protein